MFAIGLFVNGLYANGAFLRGPAGPPPPPPPPPPGALAFEDIPRGRLTQIEGWTKPPGVVGAQRKYTIATSRERTSWEGIDNDEGCRFVMSPLDDAYASMVERDFLVYWYDPVENGASQVPPQARFDVFRFTEIDAVHGAREASVLITGRGLVMDLASTRYIHAVIGGYRAYEFSDTRTAADWMTAYVIPALQLMGVTWVSLGDVDPLQHVTMAPSYWNGLRTMNELAAATECEWQLRPDGLNGFKLDLKYAIGDEAALRVLREGKSLPRLRRASNALPMVTRALPVGGKGHSPFAKTIQGLRWRVAAVNPGSSSVELVALDGSQVPAVRVADQYTTASGLPYNWHLVNVRTGRTHTITDSTPLPSVLVLNTLGTLAVGDEVEFREGVASPSTYRIWERAPGNMIYPRRVSSISTNTLTVAQLMAGDPVPTNDLHRDDLLEVSSFVAQVNISAVADLGNGVSQFTCTSTSLMAVGQWGFASLAGAEPWGANPIFTITAIDDPTHFRCVFKHPGFTGAPYTTLGSPTPLNKVRIYSVKAAVPVCTAEVASADTITVDDATGVSANDVVEFYRAPVSDLAGVVPAGPDAIGVYGIVEKGIEQAELRGETNLLALLNPVFEDWTGAAPTSWTLTTTNGAFPIQKATTGLIGPATLHNLRWPGVNAWADSGVFRALPTSGTQFVHLRVWLRSNSVATGWTGDGPVFTVALTNAASATLAYLYLYPADATTDPAPGFSKQVEPDTLVEVTLTLQLTAALAGHPLYKGLRLRLTATGLNTAGFQCGGVAAVADSGSVPPEEGYFCRYADAIQLFDVAHQAMLEGDAPDVTYEAGIHDTARLDPLDYDLELRKGVPVLLDKPSVIPGPMPSVRIVKVVRNHDRLADSKVTLDKLPDSLVRELAEALEGQ